ADLTPPAISAISAGGISNTGATITWTTDEAADAQVEYGETTAYGFTSALNPALETTHGQSLSGLSPSTIYHYRIKSRDAAGNLAVSGDLTFTTTSAPDTTPPAISGITTSNITAVGAVITWTTDEGATSKVEYGTTSAYGSSSSNTTLVTGHSRTLSGLSDATTYRYRVVSQDAAGNTALSGDQTFTTGSLADTTPPVVSGIAASNVTEVEATIRWSTDEAATSLVEYGTTTAYGNLTTESIILVTGHSRSLGGLSAGTTYHYRVVSSDGAGNQVKSADRTFVTKTPTDTNGPVISGVGATNIFHDRATIVWATDKPSNGQVLYGPSPAYGLATNTNQSLSIGHAQELSQLLPDTRYHFQVISADALGNDTISGDFFFTTASAPGTDTMPPGNVLNFSATPGFRQVRLDWTNPSDPDFVGVRIYYRTDRFPNDSNDGTLIGDVAGNINTRVSMTHSDLEDGVTYYYLASTYDRDGNRQNSVRISATTLLSDPQGDTDAVTGGGGGCGMIFPSDGGPPGPAQSADMIALLGVLLLLWSKKAVRKYSKTMGIATH
ncbi:MAG: hypothetical protein ACE5GK_09580, partial [Nitrospiria bacterium]